MVVMLSAGGRSDSIAPFFYKPDARKGCWLIASAP
jgi:hypothetical protein